MGTRLESQPYDTVTANFKLWTGFIRNLFLTTAGWTQTTDTGQTNPTTVGTAPTNGNYIYELYQATDALAGASPIIVKVEYGQSNSVPSIAITIGSGSNGTGTITGGGTRLRIYTYTGTAGTIGGTGYDCIGSGDSSGIRFLMWRNFGGTNPLYPPCFFAIERSRNSSGAYTGDYATLYGYGLNMDSANTGFGGNIEPMFRQQTVLLPGGSAGTYELAWLTFQTATASAGLGANVAAIPCFPMPGYVGNPSGDLLCAKGADFGEASSNSVSIYGSTHTFFFSKIGYLNYLGTLSYTRNNFNGNDAPINLASTQGLLFRYE